VLEEEAIIRVVDGDVFVSLRRILGVEDLCMQGRFERNQFDFWRGEDAGERLIEGETVRLCAWSRGFGLGWCWLVVVDERHGWCW